MLHHQDMLLVAPQGHLPVANALPVKCVHQVLWHRDKSLPAALTHRSLLQTFPTFFLFIDTVDLASSQKGPMSTPFSTQEPGRAEAPDALRARLWLAVWQEGAEQGPRANVRLHSEASECAHGASEPAGHYPWLTSAGLEC